MALTDTQLIELRGLIPDDAAIFGDSHNEYMLSDEFLNALYDGSGRSSILRTAGWACRAIGNSTLLIGGDIKNDEIQTNASRTAAEWRQAAKQFWDEADAEDSLSAESFDLIDPFRYDCGPELAHFGWRNPWC